MFLISITPQIEKVSHSYLLDLIAVCDSFDQLSLIAHIVETLYIEVSPQYLEIYAAIEKTARHLRHLPAIGICEVGHD